MEWPGGCFAPVPDRSQQENGQEDAAQRFARYEEVIDESGPDLREMLCLFFNIKSGDLRVYLKLLDIPYATTREIAGAIAKDQSLINKRLSTLCEENLAMRQSRKRENGGFEYRYYGRPLSETIQRLNQQIEAWSADVDCET